ncbi:MAG: thioredoxin family protein [Candidatus Nanoarchaeia archaeon]
MFDSFLFFKTPMCPNCEEIHDWLEENENVARMGEEVDATTKEGLETAKKYGVSGVPTIVLFKDGEKVKTVDNLDDFKKMLEHKSLDEY